MSLPDVSRLHQAPAGLRDALSDLGVTGTFVRRYTTGPDNLRAPLQPDREAFHRDEAAFRALRLLFCGLPDPDPSFLGTALAAALQQSGLLAAAPGSGWCAAFHLRIVEHLLLFSDYLGVHAAAVMGAGETTELLYEAARRDAPLDSLLDAGCGAGVLPLLLARNATTVTGTDINPRAIALARCNAAINGISNARFLEGDCLAPVSGQRFDLIVSQPPYFPDPPGERHTFLHGGPRGDELVHRVIEEAPRHLTAGGQALVLASVPRDSHLPHPSGADLLEIYTPQGEIPDTRQTLAVLQPAPGPPWMARFAVPAECWDHLNARRIASLLASFRMLHTGPIPAGRLQLYPGAYAWTEGGEWFAQFPTGSLIGTAPVEAADWQALHTPERMAPEAVRHALARGWLCPV